MRYLSFILICTLLLSCSPRENTSTDFPQVKALIQRQLPEWQQAFILKKVKPENPDTFGEFTISTTAENKVLISATDPVAASKGFYHYVKYVMHGHIGRMGRQIPAVEKLPSLAAPIFHASKMRHRYYLNYCTFNYSMAFWKWEDWQQELDWMAMQGINLVLAINGTEAVWQSTLRQLNFTEEEINAFIPGPAYTAWWLMDNIEGWQGPLSQEYIDQQALLQEKIIQQLDAFQMEPILPAFYGMVPNSMIDKFPTHAFHRDGMWGGLNRPAFLMPTDSLFGKVADIFYQEQEKRFGKAHFYSGDPFHEGGKKIDDMAAAAAAISAAMQKHQTDATWVLQCWQESPTDELLQGIDPSRSLLLDLFGEKEPAYCQRAVFQSFPFLWCNVNNFGNNTYQFAQMDSMSLVPHQLQNNRNFPNFQGIGLAMEGSYNDPMPYEFFYENAWSEEPLKPSDWLAQYAFSRYGRNAVALSSAWQQLYESVYSSAERFENIMCARPDLSASRATAWGPEGAPKYSQDLLKAALKNMLSEQGQADLPLTYHIDLAMTFRQYISGEGYRLLREISALYEQGKIASAQEKSLEFLALFDLLDQTVRHIPHHSLYEWQNKAIQASTNRSEAKIFLRNAQQLITLWSNEQGAEYLHDYAYREWSGMLDGFYKKRWELYFAWLWEKEKQPDLPAPNFYQWEKSWVEKAEVIPPEEPTAITTIVASYLGQSNS
ncbi:alpha-N-acetylglucosaminidase [Persicobacter psychrovividus]|uniref:Alpha-N-acetylglucosaminidase n=1 Tax=Persicobacter psychrovividus TaxID=387638 RepID=A0ABM7VLL9_9BACT|nr:alpha-N-acetylglucosaminidase [Persicobacter psychrovividus]